MSRAKYLIAALVLTIFAVVAVIFASRTNPKSLGGADAQGSGQTAPPLNAKGWINSPPLTPTALQGKVVVYDFWTYSCVNCVRTIPYIRSWYDRYKADGLVVIGIHSPEFDFEKNHANVARAVTKLGVDYPVALDDDMTIWDDFGNQYWPADYIFDRSGHEADTHFGEGGYTDTEQLLRKLLGVAPSSPMAVVRGSEGGTDGPASITPETYNGSERGADNFASPEPLTDGTRSYSSPPAMPPNDHALSGNWTISEEYVQAAAAGSAIVLHYFAGQVNLVMATADGNPVSATVQVDDRQPTTVQVSAADLYPLVADPSDGDHTIRVTAQAPGLQAYAFTFGG